MGSYRRKFPRAEARLLFGRLTRRRSAALPGGAWGGFGAGCAQLEARLKSWPSRCAASEAGGLGARWVGLAKASTGAEARLLFWLLDAALKRRSSTVAH